MIFSPIKVFKSQPLRLTLTITGLALCILLMLFLLSVYRSVADGSVEYIRKNQTDLWVLQNNAWNILRGSSILTTAHGMVLREIPGVKSASPILLLLSGIRKNGESATVFLTGYDPQSHLGGPPKIIEGRSLEGDDEIVLDKAFAAKHGYKVGDEVHIKDQTLRVVGISTGTNAFAIQYAFVSLQRAQSLIGYPTIVTCYLVKVKDGFNRSEVANQIREELPDLEVYDHETFLQNNIREMESGFLPFLWTIAVLGAVVLTAILSLLLSIHILEHRKDFAVLKVIGSPAGFLPRVVMKQALLMSSMSTAAALALFYPLVSIVEKITPEVSTTTTLDQIIIVAVSACILSIISSLISIHRLKTIYPLEAFK